MLCIFSKRVRGLPGICFSLQPLLVNYLKTRFSKYPFIDKKDPELQVRDFFNTGGSIVPLYITTKKCHYVFSGLLKDMYIFTASRSLAPMLLKISCSTQLSMKCFLLINVKMTIVGILTFISRKNNILDLSETENS